MTEQQKRDVMIIRLITEAVNEKPDEDLSWEELVKKDLSIWRQNAHTGL